MHRVLVCLLLLGFFLPAPCELRAQVRTEGDRPDLNFLLPHSEAPNARASRAAGSIQINGQLDEESWAGATPITEFTQIDPEEGLGASQATEVRILYDNESLYVGATLADTGPIATRLARRDAAIATSDFFRVLIDSYHDHQTSYRFEVNPSGVKRDGIASTGQGGFGGGGGAGSDDSWDPIWEVATSLTDGGWSAEMRIPFSQLRFRPEEDQLWGIQLEREINRNQELAVFSFTPKLERGGVPRYGHLSGIDGIAEGRRLEILPYMGVSAEYIQQAPGSEVGFSNPFRSGSDYFGRVGVDVKYRLGSNLTLDATVNPDFGQVEVDPAVINLTAFETRFEERRPFFVEGAEIFQFARGGNGGSTGRPPQVLYSRRVGRSPQGSVASDAVFSNAPVSATILGAAKVTGKVGDGWSVGLLEAMTDREIAPYVDLGGGRDETEVEPRTNYLAGRLRRDLRAGDTQIGVMATSVNRDLSDAALSDRLGSSAYVAGADLVHEWSDREWRVNAAFAGSRLEGSESAVLNSQRSSARYLQRPDAGHLDLDPTATVLSGYYAMVDLLRQSGSAQGKLALVVLSPGYEVNDLGFQTEADRVILDTDFTFDHPRPTARLRRWTFRGSPDFKWNTTGDRIFANMNANWSWQWLNYWGGSVRVQYNFSADDDRLTRGGPIANKPGFYSGNVGFNSDSRRSLSANTRYAWVAGDDGSWEHTGSMNLTYNRGENLELRFGPSVSRGYSEAQYVTSQSDSLAIETFGRRYVFAPLDQTTVSFETRLNLTVSPTLTFELYLQPLMSSGEFGTLQQFRAPGTFDFLRYGEDVGTLARQDDGRYLVDPDGSGAAAAFSVDDEDFNFRSLLGNAVLRWEWSPGSTLFLVWQQSRSLRLEGSQFDEVGARGLGDFDLSHESSELFKLRPDNIFLIKVNYWLNL